MSPLRSEMVSAGSRSYFRRSRSPILGNEVLKWTILGSYFGDLWTPRDILWTRVRHPVTPIRVYKGISCTVVFHMFTGGSNPKRGPKRGPKPLILGTHFGVVVPDLV